MVGQTFGLRFQYDTTLFTKRGHNKIMRLGNRQVARRHRDRRMRRHFENNPDTRPGGAYGYEKRSRRWQILKAKKTGTIRPLVYTGRLRASVLNTSRITATRKRWTYRARASFPLNPERRDELQAVSPKERLEDAKLLEFLYARAAKSPVFYDIQRQRIR